MIQRYCIEAFDRSMKDIMQIINPANTYLPFGGKCVVMGGDFRQILPVVPKASRAEIVNCAINSSSLWSHCKLFHLTINMRLQASPFPQDREVLRKFSQWILDVGNGNVGVENDGIVEVDIPHQFLITDFTDPVEAIVNSTYPNLLDNISSRQYLTDKAILAPTIETVNEINDYVCSLLPGDSVEYLSSDSICRSSQDSDSMEELYPSEFLNTINSSGLPPHKLTLKVEAAIMLVRNIDQSTGLCNGTRLRITKLAQHVIEAMTLNGSHPNEKVLLHRMDMNPSETRWPFKMRRRQFPIVLSFAMTINKSQGQSLEHVGLYLPKPVFSHGQLYVALSRTKRVNGLKILIHDEQKNPLTKTTNVVYKEIFQNLCL